MHPFLIMNDTDLERAYALLDELWDAEPGTPEGHLLAVMSTLVDQYEAERSSLPAADPVELIAFKLRELGWSQRELARQLGWGSGRVSEILNRKRRLTLPMIQQLSSVLGLPPGLLVCDSSDGGPGDDVMLCLTGGTARALRSAAERRDIAPQELATELLEALLGLHVATRSTSPPLECRDHERTQRPESGSQVIALRGRQAA